MTLGKVVELAPGIREFWLMPADRRPLPAYSGGSHIVLGLPLTGGVRRNPYSLVGDPEDRAKWRIAVRRQEASRGGSAWLHDHAREGQRLEVAVPANLFPMARLARHHVLVAGGIGITPILSHAREMARLGESFEVHYAFRERPFGVLTGELAGYAGDDLNLYDEAAGERIDFETLLGNRPLGTHAYLCGPAGMVETYHATARHLGWPADRVHSERFFAPPPGDAFSVRLANSGLQVDVRPDQTMLEAIEASGVKAPFLCRGGACGQCELEVVESTTTLQHHDLFLSAEHRASGKRIMPCVSRAAGGCVTVRL
jgi:ferredoxin-NADP reductase